MKTIKECILKQTDMKGHKCKPEACATCGWNPSVQKKREEYIRSHGVRKCEDGLKRLIMPGE